MTEVVGQISASTIQGQAAQISQSASAISSDKFVFFGLLDGTRNTADDPTFSLDEQTTAIGALRDQMISAQTAGTAVNTDFSYQDGVGTPGTALLSDGLPMVQAEDTARRLLADYARAAYDWLHAPGNEQKTAR
jgi:hypothetical protein